VSAPVESNPTDGNVLCKACGLCCTGHLFTWAKLRSSEMESAGALGLHVFGSDPKSRGFSQPCPLWKGECTIYTSPQYPHFCGLYKCQLLKRVADETISLAEALDTVVQTKELIQEVELRLPVSSNKNFRERLVTHLEQGNPGVDFQQKAHALLIGFKKHFGVKDLVEVTDDE
jgi:hypothetical protein